MARVLPNAVFIGSGVSRWLDNQVATPDVLICYRSDPRYLARIQRWCRRRRVPLIVDIVDWYAVTDVSGLGPKLFCALNDLWFMRYAARRCDGALVASRLLERHFRSLHVPTLMVPAVVGALGNPLQSADGQLTVTYAGTPGRREARVISNLGRLAREGELAELGVRVKMVGIPSPREPSAGSWLGIEYFGRLSRKQTLDLVSRSTFTVLQRPPDRRFAQAGFPSKVAESLLLGVPVITNLTGDIQEYLTDRQNAIVLGSEDYDALRDGIARAAQWVAQGTIDRAAIAREAADQFSPGAAMTRLTDFLRTVTGGRDD